MSTATMSVASCTNDLTVGFLGAGMMASAIMVCIRLHASCYFLYGLLVSLSRHGTKTLKQDGLVAKGTVAGPDKISCADVYAASVNRKKEAGFFASLKNADVCDRDNDAIIVAVKPQQVADVCKDIMAAKGDSLVISVAAGITLLTLETNLPGRRVVRVMPNTACLVGMSATGFAMGSLATVSDRVLVETIFGSVGLALEQKEDLLNAVTGLSGSGPAYVFQFIEALADGTKEQTFGCWD